MAKNDNLNLGAGSAAEEKSGGKGKLIIIIVAVLVLAGAAVAAFFLLSANDEPAADDVAEAAVEAPRTPIYLEMEKLLVNLEHGGRTHYVQAEMQLMSYDQAVIDQATRDMPAIRNRMIMLFSAQDFAALKTLEGKETLREEVTAAVNEVLGRKPPEAVEAVYFESFVLQ